MDLNAPQKALHKEPRAPWWSYCPAVTAAALRCVRCLPIPHPTSFASTPVPMNVLRVAPRNLPTMRCQAAPPTSTSRKGPWTVSCVRGIYRSAGFSVWALSIYVWCTPHCTRLRNCCTTSFFINKPRVKMHSFRPLWYMKHSRCFSTVDLLAHFRVTSTE